MKLSTQEKKELRFILTAFTEALIALAIISITIYLIFKK